MYRSIEEFLQQVSVKNLVSKSSCRLFARLSSPCGRLSNAIPATRARRSSTG